MEKWQKALIPGQDFKELEQGVTTETTEGDPAAAQAEETAQRTRELLSTRGWCLWKCSVLSGDIVVVILRDELVTGYPEGYPVYTDADLKELCQDGISEAALCLVHEAKKLDGANVTTKVTSDEGGNRWRS